MAARLVWFLGAAALLFFSIPAFAQSVVRVGVDEGYPPFSYKNDAGAMVGFDPDISRALCREMARKCEIVPMVFHDLFPALEKGEIDMIVAGLGITPERASVFDFTDAYYRSRSIYVGKPGSVSIDRLGLKGKRIIVEKGSMQAEHAKLTWSGTASIIEAEYNDVLRILAEGGADVALLDGLAGYAFLKSSAGEPFDVLSDPLPSDLLLSRAHIAVRKGNDALRNALNKALGEIRRNGAYDAITRTYFEYTIY